MAAKVHALDSIGVEELVDPQTLLKEECAAKEKCEAYKARYDECQRRVKARKGTTETCEEELFDFVHCVDHCVSHKLFSRLK